MHDPLAVVMRLANATNDHDLERVVACFAESYRLEAPLHPVRSFRGTDQVRRNWAQIFSAIPDISTRVVRTAVNAETVWTEWEMAGTRRDGARHLMRGVFIFEIADGLVQSGRMYLEPVDEGDASMDDALREELAGARS